MATLTASSRTATLPSTNKHASVEDGNGGYDLKACLEILKKLAPKVTPDLPSLKPASSSGSNTVPPAAHHSHCKRRSEEPDQRTAKRSRPAASAAAARSSSSEGEKLKLGKSTKGASSSNNKASSSSRKDALTTTAASASATSHKRAGSTSSVISLSELKARSDKAKLNGEDDGNASSSTARRKNISSSSKTSSNLTISTHQTSAHSISPTLPSPAPTISSLKDLKNTPQSTQNGFTSAASPDTPRLGITSEKVWTRDRFKKIAAICREKGRSLKHSGDKRMIEYSSSKPSPPSTSASSSTPFNRHLTPILALFEQIDAVILYAYAFWCEDQAAGQARNRQASSSSLLSASTNSDNSATLGASTSSSISNGIDLSGNNVIGGNSTNWKAGCITENWKSIFGLVAFVRGRAEKLMNTSNLNTAKVGSKIMEGLPRAMEIVVAWMNMLEALILQHITTNTSRKLNAQAGKLLATSSPIAATPGSTNELSPPGGDNESTISSSSTNNNNNNANTSPSTMETNSFLQSFLKLQSDLEKIHTLWPSSQNILLHPEISFLTSFSSHSTSTTLESHNGRMYSRNGDHSEKHEEDLLDLVLRKGRMAYDYEPTKLDDIVMPDLPRDEVDEEGKGERMADAQGGDNDVDADGEIDPTIPSSSTINAKTSPSNGPKSPEDLFKDEENYFRFSWPIIIHHSNSIAHTTSFGRALLFEISHRLGIDYTSPSIV